MYPSERHLKVYECGLTRQGRCTKSQLRTSSDSGEHELSLECSGFFQEAVRVALAVQIISKSSGFSISQ